MKNLIKLLIIFIIASLAFNHGIIPEAKAEENKDGIDWNASTQAIKNSDLITKPTKVDTTKNSNGHKETSAKPDDSKGSKNTTDEAVSEIFEIISDIAIKKVKNDTANVLIARIRDLFNKDLIKYNNKTKLNEVFTRTAAIVDSLSYSNLAVVGPSIKKALIEDSIELIKNELSKKDNKIAIYLYYSIINGDLNDINSQRVLEVINQIIQLEYNESEKDKESVAKIKLVSHCLCLYYNQENKNIYKIVNSIFNTSEEKIDEYKDKYKNDKKALEALEDLIKYKKASELKEAQLIELLDKGVTAINSGNLNNKQRIKVILDFYVSLFTGAENQTGVNKDVIVSLRNIIYAQLDNDNSKLVAECFWLVNKLIKNDDTKFNKKLKSIIPLLTAITAYAETYANVSNNSGGSATSSKEDIENKKKIREQILENLMTETTNRAERYDEWITSLGVNVGVNFFGWYNYPDSNGAEHYKAQLSMPLGLYLQRMPGNKWECVCPNEWNWNLGIFIFDLGQYINYDNDGNTAKPEWNTAFTVGFQGGWILGTPEMAVNFGIDFRYIPAASIQVSEEDGKDKKGGYRIGFYAATYVPFFDFN